MVFALVTAFRFLASRHCSSHSMVGHVAEDLPPAKLAVDTPTDCQYHGA
jgi:hypothetical protein